jgi:hypothetical protein
MSATQRFSHGFPWLQQPVFGALISKLLPSANVIGVVCTCIACSRESSPRSRHTTGLLRHGAIDAPRPSQKANISSLKWPRLASLTLGGLKGSVGTPVRCQCPNAGIIRQRGPCRDRCNEKFSGDHMLRCHTGAAVRKDQVRTRNEKQRPQLLETQRRLQWRWALTALLNLLIIQSDPLRIPRPCLRRR